MAAMHIVSTALAPATGKSTGPAEELAGAEHVQFTDVLGEQMEAGVAEELQRAVPATRDTAADAASADVTTVDPAVLGLAPTPAAPVADKPRAFGLDRLRTADTPQKADALKTALEGREKRSAPQAAKDTIEMLTAKDGVAQFASGNGKATQFDLSSVASTEGATPTHPLHHVQQGAVERTAQPATMTLQQPVGSERWNSELGQTLTLLVRAEQNSATLRVTPADLGPIEVQIDMSGDQATLIFSAQNADTRAALENAMPRLRDMLADGGIALGDAQVNQQSTEQRDAQAQSQRQGDGASAALAAPSPGTTIVTGRVGLVDTFA